MIKFLINNKIIKFFYAILLLPFCYSLFLTLIYIIKNIQLSNKLVQYFLLGTSGYLVIHLLLYKPIKLYVIGHELVHMISTYICGGKVKKIRIGSSYGSVNVDKVNTFIALSPYFVPFYTIIVILLWTISKYIIKINLSIEILSFFIGFTIMFHLLLTMYAIYVGQQDFKISGWLFSTVVIFIINCLILIFLFILMFSPKIQSSQIKDFFVSNTKNIYIICFQKVLKFINYIKTSFYKK
jgi:hypothetical protein